MINGFREYFEELHPGRSNFKTGIVPDSDLLIEKLREVEDNISKYRKELIVRTSDFYDGYVDGICDSLVLESWDPWLVHSFVHTYLIVKYTDKYLGKPGSWDNSLSKSLSQYYDEESLGRIMSSCKIR